MTGGGRLTLNGVDLASDEAGTGLPVLFQHGLGGDRRQTAEVFPDRPGLRRITLECRGQGQSAFGPAGEDSIAQFAADVEALAAALGVQEPVIGGISMGAAIALHLAVTGRLKPRALVLARPAWLFGAAPANMQPYAEAGRLMQDHDPETARSRFAAGATAQHLGREAPDNLASLTGFFSRPSPAAFGSLLAAIAADGPGVSEAQARALDMPTLVIGHGRDLVHPQAYAERLADVIPGAQLRIITAKVDDREAYIRDFRTALAEFLEQVA